MRIATRSLPMGLAAALVFSIACSSNSDSGAPAADGGAQDGASEASEAGDAGDGGVDPSFNADPQDLDATNGDPSLDIAGSWIYFDNNQPWVRVQFYASWPPPATLYFWSCQVFLGTADAPVVTYTVQDQNGTQTDSADGMDKTKITFAEEAKGFRVLFADATLQFDRYGLECSVKKTNTGTLAQDTSGAFQVTTKMQRTFGP